MPIAWPGKVRALGSTAAHLAHTASGDAAATVIAQWEIWDVGCGILLIHEAKRKVVDLTGRLFDPMDEPRHPFIAGAPEAIRCLLESTAGPPSELQRET